MPVKQVVLYTFEDSPRCSAVAMSCDFWNSGTALGGGAGTSSEDIPPLTPCGHQGWDLITVHCIRVNMQP